MVFFFIQKKSSIHQNKKNFIIVQQEGGLATLTTMDDNGGFGTGGPHFDLVRLFFSIHKSVSFKKLNGARRVSRDEKIHKLIQLTYGFCFFCFFFFYYIKINIFHKI